MDDNTKPSTEQLLALRKGGTPEPGTWHPDFNAVKAEAEKTGRPLVGVWINPGCGFCKRFCSAVINPLFGDRIRSIGAYLWLGSRTDADGGNTGREFVFKQSESDDIQPNQRYYFPGVAVWQCEAGHPDKVLHDYRASGRVFEKEKSGAEGLDNIIARIEQALKEPPHKEYVPPKKPEGAEAPKAAGGCPGGHPHLKAIQQIAAIIKPFVPAPAAQAATPTASALRVRFNQELDPDKRMRILNAIRERKGHCPCKDKMTPDTMCLCDAFMATDKPCVCACGLFEKYIPEKPAAAK